jgi:outer membrane protein OmpA-like peptidoglycan-associated protein
MKLRFLQQGSVALSLLLVSLPGFSATFGAGIENSRWFLSESVFDCTLSHEVPGFGRAVFRHRAGENLGFYLESDIRIMRPGRGDLVVEAPAWRPGASPRSLGQVNVADDHRPVRLDNRMAMALVSGLLDGMAPTVTRQAWYGDEHVRVRLSNINFRGSFTSYRTCVTSLLPVNYEQVKRSRIAFRSGSTRLSAGDRQLLDNIVAYVRADSTVERVFVDGHTDRAGSRIDNRALSEKRANLVTEYLVEQGIRQDMIITRAHGDQFPISNVPSQNRRTTIRLERQGERPEFQRANGDYVPDKG